MKSNRSLLCQCWEGRYKSVGWIILLKRQKTEEEYKPSSCHLSELRVLNCGCMLTELGEVFIRIRSKLPYFESRQIKSNRSLQRQCWDGNSKSVGWIILLKS
ncbi:hypothetical protein CEXT_393481 [Caerostris extrusa]|uniref:Uncharacterized protein n=1 Tax=Caerostris extrusa TaxID=172846 RepID=A0AAV4W498_CAEEX|nr:hypothetical protein CEXT_393481 [Caerostris extrusa]